MKARKVAQGFALFCILIFLCGVVDAFSDCNLPYGDPPCECCSEKWSGGAPPEFGYVVFQGIERTSCEPEWIMLPPPNNRLFTLRLADELTGSSCRWSYNLDAVGGAGGPDSDTWVIGFDLTNYFGFNVYLANKVDDPPADMRYFVARGFTDCRTVYDNELQSVSCEPFVSFWVGGTAQIFWLNCLNFGDFNGDGNVDFIDYAILANTPLSYQSLNRFTENWLFN